MVNTPYIEKINDNLYKKVYDVSIEYFNHKSCSYKFRHKDDGPAVIWFDIDGKEVDYEFWYNGKVVIHEKCNHIDKHDNLPEKLKKEIIKYRLRRGI